MGFPWFAVLRAVPWAAILANGPNIARAAERALSRARGTASAEPPPEIAALRERLAALEAQQLELSDVLRQTAEHTERLTQATDLLAARLRWMTGMAIGACVLAALSLVLATLQLF